MDKECAKELKKVLEKNGIVFHLNHAVSKVLAEKEKAVVYFKSNETQEEKTISSDYCLIAIGRKPYTEGLNAEKAGIVTDEKGRIVIDDQMCIRDRWKSIWM